MNSQPEELTLTLDNGVTLTAQTFLVLARQWAESQHTPEEWAALTLTQRSVEIAAAQEALERAYGGGTSNE